MSRRDFEAIAKIISELREDSLCWIDSVDLINKLADYFRSRNSRFDFSKFYNACNIRGGENDISDSNRSVSSLV